jgi:putative transposase
MEKEQEFDFESFKQEAIKGLYAGKPLNGEKGKFAPLLKHFLEAALAGELEAYLQQEKAGGLVNRKNGKISKKVKSLSGEFELETTRDRSGSFQPVVLPKRQLIVTAELEEKIINLYGLGLSTRDITKYIKEIYQMDISATTLSAITDKVLPAMQEWRNRPLESVYAFVYLDCMHYKVREGSSVVTRAVYNILGVSLSGTKELMGMYLSESEGAGPEIKSYFRSVLAFGINRAERPGGGRHFDCLHRWLKRLSRSYSRGLPQNGDTDLHRAPNPQQFALYC